MKLNLKKELRYQKVQQALRTNLKKRKIFQSRIKKNQKKKS
tara:strand:+ start:510 stop:632 length:123 start_codon:yes stop_codon:yes gene_type:complete